MKNDTYVCPYHNKVVEAGKPCQDCENYFKNTPIENMTLQQILDEYDLYFTDKYHKPTLTVSNMQTLKRRMSKMLGDIPVFEVMLLSDPQKMHNRITKAFNGRKRE